MRLVMISVVLILRPQALRLEMTQEPAGRD
jgi:hypothetical protein